MSYTLPTGGVWRSSCFAQMCFWYNAKGKGISHTPFLIGTSILVPSFPPPGKAHAAFNQDLHLLQNLFSMMLFILLHRTLYKKSAEIKHILNSISSPPLRISMGINCQSRVVKKRWVSTGTKVNAKRVTAKGVMVPYFLSLKQVQDGIFSYLTLWWAEVSVFSRWHAVLIEKL